MICPRSLMTAGAAAVLLVAPQGTAGWAQQSSGRGAGARTAHQSSPVIVSTRATKCCAERMVTPMRAATSRCVRPVGPQWRST
jgi:hypothetical protein